MPPHSHTNNMDSQTSLLSTSLAPPTWIIRKRFFTFLSLILVIVALVWASFGTNLSLKALFEGIGKSFHFAGEFFPPNFSRGVIYIEQMLITIKMAIWGTALAFALAVPLSVFAAVNTSPHPIIYHLTRRVLDFMRGLNEFVLALFFVVAVGLGPFAGILALFVHTAGILAKLFAEGIEDVDAGQIEAIEATGGHQLQIFTHAVWPQIVPHVVSMTLYRFESNVRAATVLGLIGAGGIGAFLVDTIRGFNFQAAGAIIIIILISVFLIDFLSAKLRERLV